MSADRRRTFKIFVAVAAVLVGIKVINSGSTSLTGPPGPRSGSLLGGWSWSGPAADPLPFSEPLRVRVPSVGIDAPLIHLGLDRDGAVAVPPMGVPTEAGWYTGNPAPGQRGVAVIVGHVDTSGGRAVFYPLGNVVPGAAVYVDRADRRPAEFRVTSIEVVDKAQFPADRVYGASAKDTSASSAPELRLITCGGAFDGQHYADNLVVYAELVPAGS
jgi:sortase (surface protein transpeptidase)